MTPPPIPNPPAGVVPALRTIADLVDEGLPAPRTTVVRVVTTDPLVVSIVLTLATDDDLQAWAQRVDTVGGVDNLSPEVWAIGGPRRWHVVVGRLDAHYAVVLETTIGRLPQPELDPDATLDLDPDALAGTAVGAAGTVALERRT